ncbi:MAG: methyltransferase domain-containing protein [Rhodobacteraceae bacterium]|nr:methyltransferase domain-containing protein [Paracoccaceae bacterium]
MQTPPKLTDRVALARNRAKAREFLLHEIATEELNDRIGLVNREFTSVGLVTGFPNFWRGFAPNARVEPDAEVLRLAEASHDLVVHALSLHWANDPVGQLIQSRRALKPDGLFLGILFGGQTLNELRTALAMAESEVAGGLSPRVLPMADLRDVGALMQRAGFALPVADNFTVTLTYNTAFDLMRDLRKMGESSALNDRPRKFTRRGVLSRAAEIYQDLFATDGGRVKATFEFIVLTGWAPHESQQKPLRPGSAIARLADALSAKDQVSED